jgi:hypothetical protein
MHKLRAVERSDRTQDLPRQLTHLGSSDWLWASLKQAETVRQIWSTTPLHDRVECIISHDEAVILDETRMS